MKKALQLIAITGLASMVTGCANTGGYFVDRGRDAADIFTATVGLGAGAKAQIGPLSGGLLGNADLFGLRGGALYTFGCDVAPYSMDVEVVCFCGTRHNQRTYPLSRRNKTIEMDAFWASFVGKRVTTNKRGHKVTHHNYPYYIPFLKLPRANNYRSKYFKDKRQPWHYYSQIEVVVGLGPSVRAGFNPGELLDFLLGWTTVDIYDDDLEKIKSNKAIDSDEK